MISANLSQKKNKVEDEIAAKQMELADVTANINAERASLGMPPREGIGTDSPEQIAARLTKDAAMLASYSDRIRAQMSEKDQVIADKNKVLIEAEQARQAISSQLGRMQSQLDQALANSSQSSNLQDKLIKANNDIAVLQESIREYKNRPSSDELNFANARIAELEAQIAALKNPPPTAAPSKLFANSVADLFPLAHGLFQGLNELEDKADLEISAAYNRFATQYKASFLKEIRFPTGSSQLNPADKMALADAIANLPDGAMVLVAGYASTTGQADANRQLSSDRATIVATNIDQAKPGKQVVQAVFLGQTKRFSTRIPERNQVCEVWQINPQ